MEIRLNNLRLFERCKRAVLFNRLQTLHGDIDNDRLAEFGDIDAAALEIGLPADLAGRVKLRRAGSV